MSRQKPRSVTLAATQMACDWDIDANIARAERLARKAADQGANVILLQELFETPYFCIEQDHKHFALATRPEDNRAIKHFRPVAKQLNAVMPISFFERANHAFFNTTAIIDSDGEVMGLIARATLRTAQATRRSTISIPATPASRSGTRATAASGSASAGTSGSPRPHVPWQ